MPGPNSGKTGKVIIGRARKYGVQMTDKEQLEATQKYVSRSKKSPSHSVNTGRDKLRRQLAKVEAEL